MASSTSLAASLTYFDRQHEVRVELDKPRLLLGRDTNVCDIVFNLPYMSRSHCAIEQIEGGWAVCDQGSRNGTYLNGERVSRRKLEDGDRIDFSSQMLNPVTFHVGAGQIVYADDEADIKSSIVNATFNLEEVASSKSSHVGGGSTWAIDLFSRMGEVLLSSESLDEMLQKVLDLVSERISFERGSVCLYDEKTGEVLPRAMRKGKVDAPIKISQSITREVIKAKKAVLVRDASQDERFSEAQSIVQMQIRSAMCAPMYHKGHVLGLIYVDKQSFTSSFTEEDLGVLTSLAVFSAVGVQQSRLREDIERERAIRARLARYSSPGVVDQIVASAGGGEMLAEEREVTVLFADLAGFTSVSERLGPSEVAQLLNRIFARVTEVVFQFEGTLDKFIGDAVMAIFGAPLRKENHAELAVRAALRIQETLAAMNREEQSAHPLAMRIGLNSGLVIAGDIGAPERKDYSVIGDTVNIASRLESAVARKGQVVVGATTYELTRDRFEFKELDEVRLRGKERTIRPYLVLGEREESGPAAGATGEKPAEPVATERESASRPGAG